jgi:malonate transporter MadM subunit
MIVYGVGMLAFCMLTGMFFGNLLGQIIGVKAKAIGLDNPLPAMIYGGLMGTTSVVAGGLAATDPKLVRYGAMTATFYTGVGCLLAPSLLFMVVRFFTD